jgi:hypothetical protein
VGAAGSFGRTPFRWHSEPYDRSQPAPGSQFPEISAQQLSGCVPEIRESSRENRGAARVEGEKRKRNESSGRHQDISGPLSIFNLRSEKGGGCHDELTVQHLFLLSFSPLLHTHQKHCICPPSPTLRLQYCRALPKRGLQRRGNLRAPTHAEGSASQTHGGGAFFFWLFEKKSTGSRTCIGELVVCRPSPPPSLRLAHAMLLCRTRLALLFFLSYV